MSPKMRVCILQSSMDGSSTVFSDVDSYAEPDMYDTKGEYEWATKLIHKASSAAEISTLAATGHFDVYLNLCDGAWDEDRAGRDVVEALERLNLPYTGSNLAFYEPSKVEMKMAVQKYGISVPAWVLIKPQSRTSEDPLGLEAGLAEVLAPPGQGGLRFPLIVKHPSGYGSIGMSRESKVETEEQLRKQVPLLVNEFGGALVEEFITGREFTVLVVEEPSQQRSESTTATGANSGAATTGIAAAPSSGDGAEPGAPRPVAYIPIECVFGPNEDFKHFDLKWKGFENLGWQSCKDEALAERLKEAACKTFTATQGSSYGRCDFRVSPSGEIFLLEINSNCGVFYRPCEDEGCSADYILKLDPAHDHMHFIRTIIATALERHRLKQETC